MLHAFTRMMKEVMRISSYKLRNFRVLLTISAGALCMLMSAVNAQDNPLPLQQDTTSPTGVILVLGGLAALPAVQNGALAAVVSVAGARINGRGLRVAAVGDFMVYLLLGKGPDDEVGRIIYGTWPTRVRYWDGSPHVAGGVDRRFYDQGSFGTPVSNRDAMYDALDDIGLHAIKACTFAFNASQDLLIGTRSGGMEGDVVAVVELDLSEATDLAATEALIANWLEEIKPN